MFSRIKFFFLVLVVAGVWSTALASNCIEATKTLLETLETEIQAGAEFNERYRTQEPSIVSFTSAVTGTNERFVTGSAIGNGASAVFLSNDKTLVVKQYSNYRRLVMYEILVTRFLKENGREVLDIEDYSNNVFENDDGPFYVVKKYVPGLSSGQFSEIRRERGDLFLLQQEHANLIQDFRALMTNEFRQWLLAQPEGPSLLAMFNKAELNSSSHYINWGDFKVQNWLLTKSGWLLIDP